ncbi:MAG TPA: hypothetical protein DD670_19130, partial [Planctomycetaceae bacterium]|nr:hypothetical protein [Planctomycetaceae bacterium]
MVVFLAAWSIALTMALFEKDLQADVLQWDGNAAALPNPAGGSGTWSGIASNWWNGTANQAYNAGIPPHDAVFGVVGGSINITAPVMARSMRFDVNGYTLAGSTITLAGSGEGSRAVSVANAAHGTTISAPIAGSLDLIKMGDGRLVLSGTNSFMGLTVREGTVQASEEQHLGDVSSSVVLDGGTLLVTGSSSIKTALTHDFVVDSDGGTFDIQNTSSTGLTITGILSGTGRLVKSGAGTLRLDSSVSMFTGGITLQNGTFRFNNNNDAGPRALRSNRITFAPTAGSATLSLGGSGDTDTGAGSDLRTGEWFSATPGAGTIVAATTVTDPAIGASGHDLVILALTNADFSGTVSNLATSNGGVVGTNSKNGELTVRGIATQTLSGTTNINENIKIFSGAGLTLAGSAALTGNEVSLNLNGGTLTLDNSVSNVTNRIYNAASIEPRGGGNFLLKGNAAGSSETLGTIQLGTNTSSPSAPRSGALNVQVMHSAGSAASTVLTFAGIQRNSGRATIDFAASDGGGGVLTLGSSGNAPRVLLSSSPALSASGLFQGSGGSGWATVNGSDFATYDMATGVKAASTVPFASATATDNALLTATHVLSGSTDMIVSSVKINPTAGQTLDVSGIANLSTSALLLAGPNDFTLRSVGTGTGGLTTLGEQLHLYVQEADLSVAVPISGTAAVVKSGEGTLILEGTNTYVGTTTINEGVVRATPGIGLGTGPLELRGGVLEITGGGTFNRHLDYGFPSGPGRVSWSGIVGLPTPGSLDEDRGSGGFAAVGADVVVDINGLGASDIVWEDPAFIPTGYSLILGSRNANARVELVDNFGLGLSPASYNAREIRVIDNLGSTTDSARISGIIFSDSAANRGMLHDLLKTGDGTLELTGDNTYIGGTIIAEGTLLLGHANALGRPAPGAYVLLGNHGGTADVALMTSSPLSIARDITVPVGSSGRASLGSISVGTSNFMGRISVGDNGGAAAKTLSLHAAAGATVNFMGPISTAKNYTGHFTLEKTGSGTVVLDAVADYTGDTIVIDGTLALAGGGSVANTSSISLWGGTFDVSGLIGGFTLGTTDTGAKQVLQGRGAVVGNV